MDPKELSLQLKKPSGEVGLEIAIALNESNHSLYELMFGSLVLKPNQQVLEIGFGNGLYFPNYFELEPDLHVTGIDFSKDMCEEAVKRNQELVKTKQLSLHCAGTSSLPLPANTFDHVVALNVIYFLDPPGPHLQEIKRVLKPGGCFHIGYRPKSAIEHLEFTHQNFTLYEPDELLELLKEHGFEKVEDNIHTYKKQPVDSSEPAFEVTDACLTVRKL